MKKNYTKENGEAGWGIYSTWLKFIGECLDDAQCEMKHLSRDMDKLGLFAAAHYSLRHMRRLRRAKKNDSTRDELLKLAMCATTVIARVTDTDAKKVLDAQFELYQTKNRRYGNSFTECYQLDGKPYAFGHLQEKINRICSLLMLDEDVAEEPLLDSFRDLLGYCVLTLCELDKEGINEV